MKRAEKDAKEDYIVERALIRQFLWKLFWAMTFLGLGYRFFHVEMCRNEK